MDGALVLDARTRRNSRMDTVNVTANLHENDLALHQSGSTIDGQWKVHRLTDADQHKQQQRCTVDIPEGSSECQDDILEEERLAD